MNELIEAIANSSIGIMMAENPIAFPWVETVHVVAITTVLGVIAIVMSIISLRRAHDSRRVAIWALALAVLSVIFSAGWLLWALSQLSPV